MENAAQVEAALNKTKLLPYEKTSFSWCFVTKGIVATKPDAYILKHLFMPEVLFML